MVENPAPDESPIEGEMSLENGDASQDTSLPEAVPADDSAENQEPLPAHEEQSAPLYSVVLGPEIPPEETPPSMETSLEVPVPVEVTAPVPMPAKPKHRTSAAKTDAKKLQAQRRADLFHTDFKELDRDLSPEQLKEWQAIYVSYRSQSILTGEVTGVDTNTFTVRNPETGQTERCTIRRLVIIDNRVKVIIPETEIWAAGEERPDHVTRSLVGAKSVKSMRLPQPSSNTRTTARDSSTNSTSTRALKLSPPGTVSTLW